MKVASILHNKGSDIITAAADSTVAVAARLLKDRRIGAVVISDDGKTVLGILSERDIVHALVEHGAATLELPVAVLMTRKVFTCSPDDSIGDLMAMMTKQRIRHLPVIRDGALCGMVSIGDVVKHRIEEVETEASAMRQFITSY
jgi:CBS domain-containing protein